MLADQLWVPILVEGSIVMARAMVRPLPSATSIGKTKQHRERKWIAPESG